jgi:DNA helicase-2/ATP-dependent DNA helicase PcrA
MRRGIPYRILGGTKFYGRREIKDILAYLYVVLNPEDTMSLLRIINVPSRKLGDTTMGKIQSFAAAHHLSLWGALRAAGDTTDIDAGTKGRIERFVSIIDSHREIIRTEPVSDIVSRLIDAVGMEKWLRDGTEEGEERWQNVLELQSVTQKYNRLDPFASLVSFLEEVALVSEVDKLGESRGDALTLMTLHLCKGLEFEHVVMTGCEEGIFPHASSLFSKEQLEEERRIMYVGMTRAKRHLTILFARSRMLWGERRSNGGSRFIEDIPEAVSERRSDDVLSAFAWATKSAEEKIRSSGADWDQSPVLEELNQEPIEEGTRIRHPSFGEGTVLHRRGDVVDIHFDDGRKKTFALSIAPIKVL